MTPEQVVEWLFSDHLGQNADVLTPVCYSPPDNPHLPRTLEDSWDREDVLAKLNELVESAQPQWKPIESVPKNRKLIVGYFNPLGNWRSIMGCYYTAGTLESDIDESGF